MRPTRRQRPSALPNPGSQGAALRPRPFIEMLPLLRRECCVGMQQGEPAWGHLPGAGGDSDGGQERFLLLRGIAAPTREVHLGARLSHVMLQQPRCRGQAVVPRPADLFGVAVGAGALEDFTGLGVGGRTLMGDASRLESPVGEGPPATLRSAAESSTITNRFIGRALASCFR